MPAQISAQLSIASPPQTLDCNWMHPIRWIPPHTRSLLDVGCNAGELLSYCRELYPQIQLSGVEVNQTALNMARKRVPDADLYNLGAEVLPFDDHRFDCITCVEVLEHIPSNLRRRALNQMQRVLRPGGRLILRVPDAGMFAWLDSANLRFLLPRLYRALLKEGRRDVGYRHGSEDVLWHHHFTQDELINLAGDSFEMESSRRGGLLLLPLMEIASWPFYRLRMPDHLLSRAFGKVCDFDLGIDDGAASDDILLIFRRL